MLDGGDAGLMARARQVLKQASMEVFADEISEFKERLQIRLEFEMRQAIRNGNAAAALERVVVPTALMSDKGMPDWLFSLLRPVWQEVMLEWVVRKLKIPQQVQETLSVHAHFSTISLREPA